MFGSSMVALFFLSLICYAVSYVLVRGGFVKPTLECNDHGTIKYMHCILANFGSPVFLLLYFLKGGSFGADNYWCRDFSDNTILDVYLLYAVQWVNSKNILDLILQPYPMSKIVAHHIVIFMVTWGAICFDGVRRVSGVQVTNIAIMEFGSIFYCVNWYWPNQKTCFVYYWLMSISNWAFLIFVAWEQTLPCANTKDWPPIMWLFMVLCAILLTFVRQLTAVEKMRAYGLWTVEEKLLPFCFKKDERIPVGGQRKTD